MLVVLVLAFAVVTLQSEPVQAQNIVSGFKSYFTCLLFPSTGGIRCGGLSQNGEIPGKVSGAALSPNLLPTSDSFTNVAKVSLGAGYTCVVMKTNTTRCWGTNSGATCGSGGTTAVTSVPTTDLPNIVNVRQVYAGYYHTCVVVDTTPGLGGLRCWGGNGYGQLGQGAVGTRQLSPPTTNAITGVLDVALGEYSTCIILSNFGMRCFGDNTSKYRTVTAMS